MKTLQSFPCFCSHYSIFLLPMSEEDDRKDREIVYDKKKLEETKKILIEEILLMFKHIEMESKVRIVHLYTSTTWDRGRINVTAVLNYEEIE